MRVIALDTHDGHFEGDEYECSESRGRDLIRKGLVKMGAVPQNKMAKPLSNKADPSAAGGEAQPSSASPAAPASPQTTAKPSDDGVLTPAQERARKAAATRAANKAARGG